MQPRPHWNRYFMEFAKVASTRSTCMRRKVGAVIVKNNMVISTGYNGAPRGITHCDVAGCVRAEMQVPSGERHELCRGVHAEQNAIIQAARYGVCIDSADLYCTTRPCVICMKMIVNANIGRVYYCEGYTDKNARAIADESTVYMIRLEL